MGSNPRYFLRGLPLLTAALFLCIPVVLSAQEYGDAYVSGSIADARTLIPILASDTASSAVCGSIYNGLVKYDKNVQLTGDLAESWEVIEEGLAIIFHLRKNVLWHDGVPLTARDVEFTYRALIDPQVRTPYSGDFQEIKSLEVIDDYTVKVIYKEPFSPGLSSWGMSIMPRHLLEHEDLHTTEFARHPVGSGPYRFRSWRTQEKIELASNHGYFEHRPYIDRVIHRVIPDASTVFLELQTEGLDAAGLTPLQFSRQTDTDFFNRTFRKFRLPSFSYVYLGYNLKDPRFRDLRIRQALNYAVDKQEILAIILLGMGRVSTGPFIPDTWSFNPSVQPAPFDPDRAVALLKEAGWSDTDNDGLIDKDKCPFEFTIITNQGNEERLKAAQVIQRRLREIGIRVKIKVIEWSVFISEFIDKRNFEAVLLGWSLARDPDLYDIWHSSKTREGEFNFLSYANEEVDRLLIEGRRTFELSQRAACYQRIQEILYEEQPCMFLYVPDSLFALHKRFRAVEQAPLGIGYNFIDWWVASSEHRYQK